MTDVLQTMLRQMGLQQTPFASNSRYYGIETATLTVPNTTNVDENTIVYLRRRLVPPTERFELLQEHTVSAGERPDLLANQYLGDPERFWQLCDANNVLRPNELTETIGRRIRITLPEGIPGNRHA